MILRAENLVKRYHRGGQSVEALGGVSLKVEQGEFVTLMGPSGSGKSTLLHLIGGLDSPTSGRIVLQDQPIESLTDDELSVFRRRKLGFIFQFFNLLPTLSALENVALPLLLDGKKLDEVADQATRLLDKMGIAKRAGHRPDQLSGGEMQRVAIARAMVTDPVLILADEPTGNLDSKTGTAVLELMRELVQTQKQTIVMVTHDPRAAAFGTRLITLRDGRIESDERR